MSDKLNGISFDGVYRKQVIFEFMWHLKHRRFELFSAPKGLLIVAHGSAMGKFKFMFVP